MVMSMGKGKMPNFAFDGATLENVTCMKYLGINTHKNGKFDSILIDGQQKAPQQFMPKQMVTQ